MFHFNTSYEAGLVNFFFFYNEDGVTFLIWKVRLFVLEQLHFLKNFLKIYYSCLLLVFFQDFECSISFSYPPGLQASADKSTDNHIWILLSVTSCFSLACIKVFFFMGNNLIMRYLCEDLFMFNIFTIL